MLRSGQVAPLVLRPRLFFARAIFYKFRQLSYNIIVTTNYYFFMDETEDHGLSFVDPNFPLFLLCGVLSRKAN